MVRRILVNMSFLDHCDDIYARFEDSCHKSMHYYGNFVSKSVYYGSNVLFLGVFIQPLCHRYDSVGHTCALYEDLGWCKSGGYGKLTVPPCLGVFFTPQIVLTSLSITPFKNHENV